MKTKHNAKEKEMYLDGGTTFEFGKYRFDVEVDAGSHPGGEIIVWVFEDGKKVERISNNKTGNAYNDKPWPIQYRRYFPANVGFSHLRNFCRKFAFDSEYRENKIKEMYDK